MAPVGVDDGGDRRGRSASRHLGLQKKKSSGSSRRRPRLKEEAIKDDSSTRGRRLKKETIKDDGGSSRKKPRLKEEAIKDDSSRRGQWLKKKTIKDDDSDDFVLSDTEEVECGREMTRAERKAYAKQVEETGGFDAIDVPANVIDDCLILPILNFEEDPRLLEVIKRCSMKAMDVYNRKHRLKGKYKFVRVLKLCCQVVAGCNYYITFEAKAEAADPVCFQAVVYVSCIEEEMEVISCRLKPES